MTATPPTAALLEEVRAELDRLRAELASARNATLTEGAELIRRHPGPIPIGEAAPGCGFWWDTRDRDAAAALLDAARTPTS